MTYYGYKTMQHSADVRNENKYLSVTHCLTVKLELEITRVYLKSEVTDEFFLLKIHFGLKTKSLVVEKRCERCDRTAVNGISFRVVYFSSHRQ